MEISHNKSNFRIDNKSNNKCNSIKSEDCEKKRRCLAFYNSLTNIPNFNYIKENISKIVDLIEQSEFAAIVYININDFRNVNYDLGYKFGDKLIVKVVSIIEEHIKDKDMLCHISTDKFGVLVRSVKNELELAGLVYSLAQSLEKSVTIEDKSVYISASLGVSIYPRDGKDLEELIRNADTAMSFAKISGKSNYKFFESSMRKQILERVELEKELREAVENKEFIIFYQPKINISTGELEGAEALVRWIHPTKGIISPTVFIKLAEEVGIIEKIGEIVIKTVCLQNKKWQEEGYKKLAIAVNLSVDQLKNNSVINLIKKILNDTELESKWLEIEITESIIMEDFRYYKKMLNKIRDLGIKVYLDDFGTGYSSLSYLKDIPIDYIKIDKSFIDDITEDKRQSAIVSALIQLAHGIDLKVVAEGVEEHSQLKILREYNCDLVQGYIFSKPVSKEDFEKMLKSNNQLVHKLR
ncbi:bifunctional diguanylate cyclase/phosphodiesterase [Clostridium sp. PL3]|uniref:Bifunctional diguanylate cyclase/phosphodiesterase n=1 Tax=Clostridium thailandense TaxID=2794346 RepID=A0A949WPN1_9CLOT|nr:bifunctional diguanylate cyclase/phosphodiesterase [Clostridium thailandense]MBV7271505.1 bifunctional diguanylate cyclase/phosphodiesterase [Clostridium thailandense]